MPKPIIGTDVGHYRNVRGLGESMIVFRLFEKLRYSGSWNNCYLFTSTSVNNCSKLCHYDENHIFSIEAISKPKQVAWMRRKMLFTIFKYLFLFQRYSSF